MSASTTVYLISVPFLAVFAVGMYRRISFWLEGSLEGRRDLNKGKKSARIAGMAAGHFYSRRVLLILEAVALDFIAGRNAFMESKLRWLMHSLILWGFLGLMIFDAVEVAYIRGGMDEQTVKNLPRLAFAFDLSGAAMIAGVVVAVVRRLASGTGQLQNTAEDVAAIVLLATMVISGYLLEGFRFLLNGVPAEVSRYAFVGHLIAATGTPGSQWDVAHGVFWYLHMLTSLAFIAYIPFGKFIHLFAAPLVIAASNLSDRREA
jgi:nitrate reductase gamma subunit